MFVLVKKKNFEHLNKILNKAFLHSPIPLIELVIQWRVHSSASTGRLCLFSANNQLGIVPWIERKPYSNIAT